MSAYYVVQSGDASSIFQRWADIERHAKRGPEGIRIFAFSSEVEATEHLLQSASDSTAFSVPHVDKKRRRSSEERSTAVIEIDDDATEEMSAALDVPSAPVAVPMAAPVTVRAAESLSADQQHVFNLVKSGRSVFFTGAAGTGKSFLFRQIKDYLIALHGANAVGVTATTGAAAVNVRGVTIHSLTGLGIGEGTIEAICARANANRVVKKKIQELRWLMVDEISMLSKHMMTAADAVFKHIRGNRQPFGGVRVVLTGDFLQLPPVTRDGAPIEYAFDSEAWAAAVPNMYALQIPHRQKDSTLIAALNDMRRGVFSARVCSLLLSRVNADVESPVKLYPHKATVDAENERELALLPGEPVVFEADDRFSNQLSSTKRQAIEKNWPVDSRVELKVGAAVVLLRNVDLESGLCNGSQGTVVSFTKVGTRAPIVKFRNGVLRTMGPATFDVTEFDVVLATRKQVPLALAYAITIHKAQGMTLQAVRCNVSRAFAPGQVYVCLSRTPTVDGLSLDAMPVSIEADQRAVQFHRSIGDCKEC